MLQITFTPAQAGDVGVLMVLMRSFYTFEDFPFDEAAARTTFKLLLQEPKLARAWLIQADSDVIGYVVLTFGFSFEYQGRDAIVDEIFIREGYRGQGIGRRTFEFLQNTCATLEVKALHLEVERKNTAAKKFYDKLGFEAHDRYFMTKLLENTR